MTNLETREESDKQEEQGGASVFNTVELLQMMGQEKTGVGGGGWGERVGSCSRVKSCHGDSAAEREGWSDSWKDK